jgi:steroid delta-isomerase-like uncharacterized protein
MTRDEIVEFFARRQQILSRHDPAAVAALHTEDGVFESAMAGTLTGRHDIEKFYRSLFSWFPDFSFESEEIVIDGARVVQTATFGGTDRGGFMGGSPTGKHMRITGVFFYTLRGLQNERMRSIYDFTSLLAQIGTLKIKPT